MEPARQFGKGFVLQLSNPDYLKLNALFFFPVFVKTGLKQHFKGNTGHLIVPQEMLVLEDGSGLHFYWL